MKRSPKKRLNRTTKKRKVPGGQLCSLPTDILSRILSELPINDAIRTSVLSKKWKYIWCHHTNLIFNSVTMRKNYFKTTTGYGYGILSDNEFITRVDAVLREHSGAGVEHMEVNFKLGNRHADHIERWIDFAIASKAKEFVVNLSNSPKFLMSNDLTLRIRRVGEEPYNLPTQLLSADNGSCLRILELTSVSLQLPADFKGFRNLKNLTLVDVRITDQDVQRVLSRCTLLEFLEIACCRMVTRIQTPCPLDRLNLLVVDNCPSLQGIDLNCSPVTVYYTGTVVPLLFASTSRLSSICMKFLTYHDALDYMITGFPSTLPRLKKLTLLCAERERTISPGRSFRFNYLRHLNLELIFSYDEDERTDALDYAQVLEVAPFIEKLELRMWMRHHHGPYRKEDGDLRTRAPHQHAHLKFVRISGFFGHKDQVELATHILQSSIVLEKMEITPRIEITHFSMDLTSAQYSERAGYMDGHRVATEFVRRADHRNVVEVERPSFPEPPPLDSEHQEARRRLRRLAHRHRLRARRRIRKLRAEWRNLPY